MARVNYEMALARAGVLPRTGTYGMLKADTYGRRLKGVSQGVPDGTTFMPGTLSPRSTCCVVSPCDMPIGSTCTRETFGDEMKRHARLNGVTGTRHRNGRFDAPGVGTAFRRIDGDGVRNLEGDIASQVRTTPEGEPVNPLPVGLDFPVVLKGYGGPSSPGQANAHRPKTRPSLGAYSWGFTNWGTSYGGAASTPFRAPGGAIQPGFRSWISSWFRPWTPRIRDYLPGSPEEIGLTSKIDTEIYASPTTRSYAPRAALPVDLRRGGTPTGMPLSPLVRPVAQDDFGPYSPPNRAVATAVEATVDAPGAPKMVAGGVKGGAVVATLLLVGLAIAAARR